MIDLTNEEDYSILKLDLNRLNAIINRLTEEHKNGNVKIDIDRSGAGIGFESDIRDKFLDEFQLNEDNFRKITSDILFFIVMLVMDEEEAIFKKYGKEDNTEKILELFKQQFQKYPSLIRNLRFRSSCKTQYFEDLTWEVSIKVRQGSGIRMRLPVSVIKMNFLRPSSSKACPLSEEKTVSFECTLEDIEEIMRLLQEVKLALEELEEKGEEIDV